MQTCLTLALTSLLFKCWWALCCQLATGNAVCVLNESWEWLPNTKMFVKLAAHLFPPWEWEASQQIGPILHRNCQAGSDHASLWFCGPRGTSARSTASQGTLCTPAVAVCPEGPFPDPVNYIYSQALKTGSPCHRAHLGLSDCFWPLWYPGRWRLFLYWELESRTPKPFWTLLVLCRALLKCIPQPDCGTIFTDVSL